MYYIRVIKDDDGLITIKGIPVDIDVVEEVESFNLDRQEIYGDELKACSPFREERNPSFYLNIETGLWKDFGSDSDDWGQGNLIKLLSFLHNMDYEETEIYLLEKYNIKFNNYDELDLNINIQIGDKVPKVFNREDIKPYLYRNKEYLLNRGVSETIQKRFVICYCPKDKSVAFLWREFFAGDVVAIKFRNIYEKKFYYKKGGQSVSNHIYGLYEAKEDGADKIYLVESEIDALYLWTHGVPAVAVGGSSLSKEQERLLLLSGLSVIVIATDRDDAGNKLKRNVIDRLGGNKQLYMVDLPVYASDINDVKPEDIKKVTDSEKPITIKISLP